MPKIDISTSRRNSKRGIPKVSLLDIVLSEDEAKALVERFKKRLKVEFAVNYGNDAYIIRVGKEPETYAWLGKEKDESKIE